MPVRTAVKAVATPVVQVAAIPVRVVQAVQPVRRVATVVRSQPLRKVARFRPVRRLCARFRCR